jgi:excisionase family DNA binding protein
MTKKLFTIKESMQYLNVSKSTIYNLIADGELKTVKILSSTRITIDELDDCINRNTKSAA